MAYDYERGFEEVLYLFRDALYKAQETEQELEPIPQQEPEPGKTKYCSKCRAVKGLEEFSKNRTNKDGLHHECKECVNVYQKTYRKTHAEKIKDESRIRSKAHYEKHRERYINQHRYYYKTHREQISAYQKTYHKAHPEISRNASHRYRARKKRLANSLTNEDWLFLLETYNHSCAYCGSPESEAGILHQEHIIPSSRGGGYTIHNIVPACPSCNHSKKDKTPHEAGMKLRRIPLKQLFMFNTEEEEDRE